MASGAGKDVCRYECAGQMNDSLENQVTSGTYEDNEDTKEDNVTSPAGINSSTTPRNSQFNKNEDAIRLGTTPFPDHTKKNFDINEANDANQKLTSVAAEHRPGDEHEAAIGEKTTFPEDTKQHEQTENKVTESSPKIARGPYEQSKAYECEDFIIQETPPITKQHIETDNEITGSNKKMTRVASEQGQGNEDVIGQEPEHFPDDTKQQKEIKDEFTDSSQKTSRTAPEHSQEDEHEEVIGEEATLSPEEIKQHVEKENEFTDCNQKTARVAAERRPGNEHEDVIGQEPTQFPDSTKQTIEKKNKDMDGSRKTNRATPDQSQADEHKGDIGKEVMLIPHNTKQQKEMNDEVTYSLPKLTRGAPEHSQDDTHEDVIRLEATAVSDKTKQHTEKEKEFTGCNQTPTREDPEQSQADESVDVLVQEASPFSTDTKLQIELKKVVTDSSLKTNREALEVIQQGEEKMAEKLFSRLNLVEKQKQKIKTLDVLQITSRSLQPKEPCTEKDLVETFLQRLLMMNYRARYITTEEEEDSIDSHHTDPGTGDDDDDDKEEDEDDGFDDFFSKKTFDSESHPDHYPVHPMDVQMAVFHCSDHFLKQLIMNKLAQCQYGVPLLVPNPFTRDIECPLWPFRQIRKCWKTTESSGKKISKTQVMYEAETPMVAFFRFGSASLSKSQLMNSLINEKHYTFFHRHCPGSSKNRVLLDGVVEIAWYCPSGEETDYFPDCVAFCNLHGDAEINKKQLHILTEMSSVNVVLVSDFKKAKTKEMHKLYRDTKPLICLISDDESCVSRSKNGSYKIGLKDRNQSDVAKNLKMALKESLSKSCSVFKIENLYKHGIMVKDEDDPECEKAKEAAKKIMSQLEGKDISKLKEEFLPYQGKLWHEWCEINKNLHRLQGNNLEMQMSKKQRKMMEIREQQRKCSLSGLMEQFVSSLNSLGEHEQSFFLKWVGILLDRHTSDHLSDLHHIYNEKWTVVLDLKNKHDKSHKIKHAQEELDEISEKLNAATFGLEHILREMGQIYESFISVHSEKGSKGENVSYLPKLAAELVKSGHPMELMDGDAAHVPLTWVSAVLDELVKILGDQRVFVLSVLGIQSSGKSTMLNAMFGLQFAVGAGRCTRGAFMQLVSVSEEMKEELKFDCILVVDTEGLRALELTGNSTRHHDNELATFNVGLGNLTLINIFGENPAEMQDILQIVVQAFLRMKKVRLNPSCVFVHQNVGDITAGEKTMEGRRRLQEKLDEMTKLAAIEEDSEADCFRDVIEFNVQEDVYYFAQLWEGSPPMAPPNPCYSRNVQNLKNAIFKKAPRSQCITLSQFKSRISDLWNALLNENFVFSFKNTLEISVYRKLENEFEKWTWDLRSTMLDIEETLYNRTENENLKQKAEKDLYRSMEKTKALVDKSMSSYFENDKDKDILIQWHASCENKIKQLYDDLVRNAKQNLNEIIQQQHAQQTFEHKRTQKEYEAELFSRSKELALKLKSKDPDEQILENEFDKLWGEYVTELTQNTPPERSFDFWEDAVQILSVDHEEASVFEWKSQRVYKQIDRLGDYSCYIVLNENQQPYEERQKIHTSDLTHGKAKLSFEDQNLVGTLSRSVINECETLMDKICNKIQKLGYKNSYIRDVTDCVKLRVKQHHNENQRIKLTEEFTLDLCLYVCELASHRFTELHKQFRDANDPGVYLSKQKPKHYGVFKNYCRGATTAKVFGELICSNLRESILQAVYNKMSLDLTAKIRSDMPEFSGNRSNLEKYILKCLAEEEDFEKYREYIHNPKQHFKHFIAEKVNVYIADNTATVLNLFKGNLKDKEQKVINAVHNATEEVKNSRGDAEMWLRSFYSSLKDEPSLNDINFTDVKEITDFGFLQQAISQGLREMMSELEKSFDCVNDIKMETSKKRSYEILTEHLSQCCWVQCPFCCSICTNTIEGHDGDHSVPFHRVNGISGMCRRGTTDLCSEFCTTLVQSNKSFYPSMDTDTSVPYRSYRTGGGVFATWSITPDNSQLTYWKWFVCRFQEDLEKDYEKTFQGPGEISSEWRTFTKTQAIESLDKYI